MAIILVTGSNGTIGRPLVKELRARGHEVIGSDISHSSDPEFIRLDVGDYRDVDRAIDYFDPEYVYHLAGEFGRHNGEDYYEKVWRTNAIGTRNILEAQRRLGDFKLIFASSSEIYGELTTDNGWMYEELSEEKPLRQHNDYAISKWVNEQQIMNAEERYGNQVMRLRFFNAYGPGEYYHPYRSVVCLFCYKALNNLPITVFEGYERVFMYIDDFIPTLANCVDGFKTGEVVNIGGREKRSVEELLEIVLSHVPEYSGKVTKLKQDEHNVVSKAPHLYKAIRFLGHDPKVMLEEGVAKTIEWMRSVYQIDDSVPSVAVEA